MSAKVDELAEGLQAKLVMVESRSPKVNQRLRAASGKAAASISSEIDEAKARHEEYKQEIAEAKAQLDERIEAKKAEVAAEIEKWKRNREIHKLDRRADEYEDYALASIDVAAAAIAEADLATLEAIEARLHAEEAAAT